MTKAYRQSQKWKNYKKRKNALKKTFQFYENFVIERCCIPGHADSIRFPDNEALMMKVYISSFPSPSDHSDCGFDESKMEDEKKQKIRKIVYDAGCEKIKEIEEKMEFLYEKHPNSKYLKYGDEEEKKLYYENINKLQYAIWDFKKTLKDTTMIQYEKYKIKIKFDYMEWFANVLHPNLYCSHTNLQFMESKSEYDVKKQACLDKWCKEGYDWRTGRYIVWVHIDLPHPIEETNEMNDIQQKMNDNQQKMNDIQEEILDFKQRKDKDY